MAIPTVKSAETWSHEMPDSHGLNPINNNKNNNGEDVNHNLPDIPKEIVTDEEMALIEASLASAAAAASVTAARSSRFSSFSGFRSDVRSIQSITLLSKRTLSGCTQSDIEDLGVSSSVRKRNKPVQPFLIRFRKNRGVSVTDLTSVEWCGKQIEYSLELGKPKKANKVMKAGSARHAMLEEEVIKRVEVRVKTVEDRWAQKLMAFVSGVNQLLSEGLTRELPVMGYVDSVWIVGIVDEIRMPATGNDVNPMLVDTKTRARDTLPRDPQRRNGKFQLMMYKYLWDNLITTNFPSTQFFDYFSLNPHSILSEDIREATASSGFKSKTLEDVVRCFQNTCSMLPPADIMLLLIYESQKDHSVLGEERFAYDHEWLKSQLDNGLQFWKGEREASFTPEEERWKCRSCQFASLCPATANLDSSSGSSDTNKL